MLLEAVPAVAPIVADRPGREGGRVAPLASLDRPGETRLSHGGSAHHLASPDRGGGHPLDQGAVAGREKRANRE